VVRPGIGKSATCPETIELASPNYICGGGVVVVVVLWLFTSGAGVVVVVVVSVCFIGSAAGVVVVVVESVCFTLWCLLYLVLVSVVCVVWAGIAAGSCEVVVVVLWVAGGAWVVVEVLDCVVLCAITGSDRANTISVPRTTASRFFDFIGFSFISLARCDATSPLATKSEHNCSLPVEGVAFRDGVAKA
jgi:hypothetical protein